MCEGFFNRTFVTEITFQIEDSVNVKYENEREKMLVTFSSFYIWPISLTKTDFIAVMVRF